MTDFQRFKDGLEELKIRAELVEFDCKGSIQKYLIRLDPSFKIKNITACATELALIMQSYGKPTITPITEIGLVQLEFITRKQEMVGFDNFHEALQRIDRKLPLVLGRTYKGEDLLTDLVEMPHLLVAGSTGSGKSVMLHSIISSLILNRHTNLKMVLIDPKSVELNIYKDVKNLLAPVITTQEEALKEILKLIDMMNDRFKIMSRAKVNNLAEYNMKTHKEIPYVVLVIDEFSDLMSGGIKKEFQKNLTVLAQKCRASGIHIVIATQRPEAKIITGAIKANFPARISFRVPSFIDSRVILDRVGAETLLGAGDGILNTPQHDMVRFKGAFLDSSLVNDIVEQNKCSWLQKIWSRR